MILQISHFVVSASHVLEEGGSLTDSRRQPPSTGSPHYGHMYTSRSFTVTILEHQYWFI
jgi:hypothetical protein